MSNLNKQIYLCVPRIGRADGASIYSIPLLRVLGVAKYKADQTTVAFKKRLRIEGMELSTWQQSAKLLFFPQPPTFYWMTQANVLIFAEPNGRPTSHLSRTSYHWLRVQFMQQCANNRPS